MSTNHLQMNKILLTLAFLLRLNEREVKIHFTIIIILRERSCKYELNEWQARDVIITHYKYKIALF